MLPTKGNVPCSLPAILGWKTSIIYPGESALKECSDIEAVRCEFRGKYPFWHNDGCWWNIACSGKAPGPPSGIPGICT